MQPHPDAGHGQPWPVPNVGYCVLQAQHIPNTPVVLPPRHCHIPSSIQPHGCQQQAGVLRGTVAPDSWLVWCKLINVQAQHTQVCRITRIGSYASAHRGDCVQLHSHLYRVCRISDDIAAANFLWTPSALIDPTTPCTVTLACIWVQTASRYSASSASRVKSWQA